MLGLLRWGHAAGERNATHGAGMPFYRDYVYPHLVSALGNPKPIEDIRRLIVPLAQGRVLEIVVGPGLTLLSGLHVAFRMRETFVAQRRGGPDSVRAPLPPPENAGR